MQNLRVFFKQIQNALTEKDKLLKKTENNQMKYIIRSKEKSSVSGFIKIYFLCSTQTGAVGLVGESALLPSCKQLAYHC